MRKHGKISLGLAMLLGSPLAAFGLAEPVWAQGAPAPAPAVVAQPAPAAAPAPAASAPAVTYVDAAPAPASGGCADGSCGCGTGPVPLTKVGIIDKALFGDCEKPFIHISAW